jgi:hypothetical protein
MKKLTENNNVWHYDSLEELFIEEDMMPDEYPELETRNLDAGTVIYLQDAWEAEEWEDKLPCTPVLQLETSGTIGCQDFHDGFTSDHWLVFQEEGQLDVWVIYNEPEDFTSQRPGLEPKELVFRTQ